MSKKGETLLGGRKRQQLKNKLTSTDSELNMKNFFLTPGPSELYPTVEDHVRTALRTGIASISHRSSDFKKIFAEAKENLKLLLDLPDGFDVVFLGSANEIWERSLQNLVEKQSAHFVNGAFSEGYAKFAKQLRKKTFIVKTQEGNGFELSEGEIPEDCEFIALTANETSTGVMLPSANLSVIRRRFPNAIVSVDAVSILPCYETDFTVADTIFFSVQKAFGLPAGLGVWIFNEKCLQKAEKMQAEGHQIGTFHALPELAKRAKDHQTPETPNVLAVYLLAKVAGDMLRYGKERMMREQTYKANLLYHTLEKSSFLTPLVKNEKFRSPTVVVAECERAKDFIEKFAALHHVRVGSGYGNYKDKHIRIANFPAASKERIEMFCDCIEGFEF